MTGTSTVLFPQILDSDYLVFTIVGKGWMNGELPYVSLFDHKGPIIYIIQMAGLWMNIGKWGVWIIELLFYLCSFEIIYRIGHELRLSKKNSFIALFLTAIFYFAFLAGNSVEEWSLPFQLIPLWLVIKYYNGKINTLNWTAFVSGLCFGVVALMRLNNNCIICGLVIGLIIYLIQAKKYAALLKATLAFIIGICIIIIPFTSYFYFKDAVSEFIYANLIFNLHYRSEWEQAPYISNFIKLLACVLLPIVSCLYDKLKHSHYFATFTSISLITFLTFISGTGFSHYYLMTVPLAALCFQMSSYFDIWKRILIAVIILLPLFIGFRNKPARNFYDIVEMNKNDSDISLVSKSLKDYIPTCEQDSIYAFGAIAAGGAVYELNKLPLGKYFFLQSRICNVDEFAKDDIVSNFEKANPVWIISSQNIERTGLFKEKIDNYCIVPIDSLPKTFPKKGYYLYHRKN